jgi:uncharacterized protein
MVYRPYRKSGINPLWVIIGVTVIIYIATLLNQSMIYQKFGLITHYWMQQPWSLLTYMFLHGSFWHLFANMIGLYFLGGFVYAIIGENPFLVVYFIGGIVAALTCVLFGYVLGPKLIVGASGAIYALGGVLVMMRPKTKVFVFPLPVAVPLWAAILFGFLIISFSPNIAWEAHLGGLVFGLIVGYYYRRRERMRYVRY